MDTSIKKKIDELYLKEFNNNPEAHFSCGGRFEILGNHTDHNHGLCLAATCDLAIYSAVSKNDEMTVRFVSEGYPASIINLNKLNKSRKDNSSEAMVKGIAKYLVDHGYKIGGLNATSYSTIFAGAGVSSSAAFQLLIGQLFNHFYNNDKIDMLTLCKAGQYSENEYFGKKSGLLDQIGVANGEISYIDFKNIEKPQIIHCDYPFDDLRFVIVNTGGSHATLNDLYSSIPMDMYSVANKLGKHFLRECTVEDIYLSEENLTLREKDRAVHYFTENERVQRAIVALSHKNKASFLNLINESRLSSTRLLKNMMVGNQYEGSPLQACDIAMKLMNNEGACKINGGGFAGSIICVVPESKLKGFIDGMSVKYGKKNIREVHVRKTGPCEE